MTINIQASYQEIGRCWLDSKLNILLNRNTHYKYTANNYYIDIDEDKLGVVDTNPDNEDDEKFVSNINVVITELMTRVCDELKCDYVLFAHADRGVDYEQVGHLRNKVTGSDVGGAVKIERSTSDWNVSIWASSSKLAHRFLNTLRDNIPIKEQVIPPRDESKVPITFWRMGRQMRDIRRSQRTVTCPAIEDIKDNYVQVYDDINKLFTIENPTSKGKIVLWHGPPGMGKTYAIRSLARNWHWRLDASIEVVLDPENLFGNADYMHDLILNNNTKLRLIIVEDSEEFLNREHKESRQGFARLLNLTDGIIGQGTNVVFMLTANAAFEQLDAAIIRPGRCLQELEFGTFNNAQTLSWISLKMPDDYDYKKDKEFKLRARGTTLADLYALHNRICPPTDGSEEKTAEVEAVAV